MVCSGAGSGKLNRSDEPKGVRKYHRQIGIAVAFVALTFTFSGALHATRKLHPNQLPQMVYEPIVRTDELAVASLALPVDWERLYNLSVVRKSKKDYFQAFYTMTDDAPSETVYINAADSSVWENGNIEYAKFLGKKFQRELGNSTTMSAACCEEAGRWCRVALMRMQRCSKQSWYPDSKIASMVFVFKRLPVVRLMYETPDETALYVETATSAWRRPLTAQTGWRDIRLPSSTNIFCWIGPAKMCVILR